MPGLLPAVTNFSNPYPNYEVKGAADFLKSLRGQKFQLLLATLLHEAGVKTPVTVVGNRKIPGSEHTRGLGVGSYSAPGIYLTWHDPEQDNGHNIQMLVRTPTSVFRQTHDFHGAVLRAHDRLIIRQRVIGDTPEEGAAKTDGGSHGANGASADPGKIQMNGKAASPADVQPGNPTTAKIDDDTGQLIVAECVQHLNGQGRVLRRQVLHVLTMLEYAPEKRGPAMKSLIAKGHFTTCEDDEDLLEIGDRWREQYFPKKPEEVLLKSPVVPAPTTAAALPTGTRSETLQTRVGRLQQNVSIAKKKRSRIESITREKLQLGDIIKPYAEQIARLESEEVRLKAELENPDLKDAEVKYAAVNAALN